MRSFKSNENIPKKEGGSEEKYCNFSNFKKAVDSKTDMIQNGIQIIKHLSRICV